MGRHVTAGDFKYAIERLFRLSSPGAPFYRHIVGAEAMMAGRDSVLPGVIAHGDSLYVRLDQPDPIFLEVFSMSFTSPLPREWVERWPDRFSQHTVSTGPFRVAEYVPRQRVLLVRNPAYCGQPAWLDTFELRLSVSTINAVSMIRRGHGLWWSIRMSLSWSLVRTTPISTVPIRPPRTAVRSRAARFSG